MYLCKTRPTAVHHKPYGNLLTTISASRKTECSDRSRLSLGRNWLSFQSFALKKDGEVVQGEAVQLGLAVQRSFIRTLALTGGAWSARSHT
jgi:hypothetical protein